MVATSQTTRIRADGERTRDLILQSAARCFAERGFEGTSLRDIGEAAGINFQSIRYHFGSKEDLWEAVVASLSRQALEAGIHHEQATLALQPKDQLRAQIRAIAEYQIANPELWTILTREAMKNSERYRRIFSEHVAPFYELTEKFLRRMQKAGVIKRSIPTKDLVLLFRGALNYRLVTSADSRLYTGQSLSTTRIAEKHADALTRLLCDSGGDE